MSENVKKDLWDKAEIISKFLIPAVVALVAYNWNSQKSDRDAATAMVKIAVGILSVKVEPNTTVDPLRQWAINVMRNPSNPPKLSEEAAGALTVESLVSSSEFWNSFGEPSASARMIFDAKKSTEQAQKIALEIEQELLENNQENE